MRAKHLQLNTAAGSIPPSVTNYPKRLHYLERDGTALKHAFGMTAGIWRENLAHCHARHRRGRYRGDCGKLTLHF